MGSQSKWQGMSSWKGTRHFQVLEENLFFYQLCSGCTRRTQTPCRWHQCYFQCSSNEKFYRLVIQVADRFPDFCSFSQSVRHKGLLSASVLLSARTTGQIAVSRPIVWNNGSDPVQNTSHQAYFKTIAEQCAQILTPLTTWPSTFCISLSLNAVTGMRVTNRTGNYLKKNLTPI